MNSLKLEPGLSKKTMDLLWIRVRERGDLPCFSKAVSAIIKAMHDDSDREFNMTQTVLHDPALTQKVLRLANSAMYSVFGQGISTISKAVIVLGTETIGHLALGLKLIDGLAGVSSDSASACNEMETAVLAGHIARQVAASASAKDIEEAVVCSMLHPLGRMMVAFYMPDRWQQIQARCARDGVDEETAAFEILGIDLIDIGRLVAQQWGLPKRLANTLTDLPPKVVSEPLDHGDWLAAISTLSSQCAKTISEDPEGGEERIVALAGDYAEMLGLQASQVLSAVVEAKSVATEENLAVVRPGRRAGTADQAQAQAPKPAGKPPDSALILARGVADMRDAAQSASTGQLITMALESIYQGLGFSRAVAFLRNQEKSRYAARMCFGEGVQELLPRLAFDDAYQPDVFHAALGSDKMVFAAHAQDPAFLTKVPRWWREAFPTARSFMILPLTVNRQPVGLFYGDWDLSLPAAKIDHEDVAPLNELRALIIQAMENRRRVEPSWTRRAS
jgi:HD-like signal output (HDOD) protein